MAFCCILRKFCFIKILISVEIKIELYSRDIIRLSRHSPSPLKCRNGGSTLNRIFYGCISSTHSSCILTSVSEVAHFWIIILACI
ncbi:unnamed protein product [Moneuplotes crassus]|uniref:Uncharacterized protein n=1 Tax=Euplotes crassus TaxID=5936 RepID=A0AAD1USP1_EUPCR|nr:unnamed protein product [Moneuplotes crassus]